ncbi:MAG: aldo/keto reductase [Paracoccus sp. (in: a-proteobacteria)]|uniref:aldo/keto reductase n=1 Tax=Paracoccus sp. TaxID=267 RepID=UPI0026E01F6D|nr:aldo/keto reductase [Paracoccus sp. (in: a-proteobacteria)]MDO5631294.1 aldo/keto reductase [Paracoccus sp. (in: a-proteobacteria)]
MERVQIAPGLNFSRMIYGLWRLGDASDTSPAHVQAKVEACLAQGITTLDHADIYSDYGGEALLGAAFRAAPGLRDRVEVVTKCNIVAPLGRHADARVKHYDTSPAYITAAVERSLRDLATDRVDLLLLHRPDPLMDADATGPALDALVASGKVRAVGVSNFRPWDTELLQSRMATPLAANQIEISLLAHAPLTNGDLAWMQRARMPVMAWSPLGGGSLFASGEPPLTRALQDIAAREGVDMAAVAVAWLLAHPARIMPVMGTNDPDRIARLSDALRVRLDRQDWFTLYQAALGHEVP